MRFGLDVGREDWTRTPGRYAMLEVGPFVMNVSTADGWKMAFYVHVGQFVVGWEAERELPQPKPAIATATGVAEAWAGHALIPDTDENGRLVFRNSWAETEAAKALPKPVITAPWMDPEDLYDEAKEMDRWPLWPDGESLRDRAERVTPGVMAALTHSEAMSGPCPGGCGCRLYSPDADPADCGCDSYCTMDTSDWPKWSAGET